MQLEKVAAEIKRRGKTVLVLQGGGALGAYQVGVYAALAEAGVEPDWVIGTSIGAINGSIIAGNAPEDRLSKLETFWDRVEQFDPFPWALPDAAELGRNMSAIGFGLPGFFTPNPWAFLNPFAALGPEEAAYYSTEPLRETLSDLIDFDRINAGKTRLTVGAACVEKSKMEYFDSAKPEHAPLRLDHTMASGALPPAFPAVRIDDKYYWDGGILSNTPIEAVFDEEERECCFIISVQLWNHDGHAPHSIWQVLNRKKDLQFSSRADSHIQRQKELHGLRHALSELADLLPEDVQKQNRIASLLKKGCKTRMHVVRLLAAPLPGETHMKDIDFSAKGIAQRRAAGYRDTIKTLMHAPWKIDPDPHEGLILHDACRGELLS